MKINKSIIISASIIAGIYLLFLILPLIVSPILNAYSKDISSIVSESSGYKITLEKLGIITTPKLTAGVKVGKIEAKLPTDDVFLTADNVKAKISLLPLIIGKIEADVISADSINANLDVRQDGHLLLEEYLPQPDPDKEVETMSSLPLGFKLSNKLPDIYLKKYNIKFTDMTYKKDYILSGNKFKISDFILDKKVKLSTDGEFTLNDNKQFTFDIKVLNKIMPDLSLNDIVFNPTAENTEQTQQPQAYFNILDIFRALNQTQLSANIKTDITADGEMNSPEINGYLNIEDLTMLVNGNKLPLSSININSKSQTTSILAKLYPADNEFVNIDGNFKYGNHKNIELTFKANTQLNNLFKILNSVAKSFNYNDFETLSATGNIDADFYIKSNTKKVSSKGYLKIPNSNINYKLYNLALNNINADINFDDELQIKQIALSLFGQPLKIFGTVKNNSDTDIHITAENILLKGLIAAAGQIQVLKENSFNSGSLSLDASLKGKLSNIIPTVNLAINNLNVKNIPSNTTITMPNAKFILNTKGKSFTGDLSLYNLKVNNPMFNIALPDSQLLIQERDIDIQKAYLLFNNSRIDINGNIKDYMNDKLAIDISAKGNVLANDIKTFIPNEMRSMFKSAGQLPLVATVKGNLKKQNISLNINANPSNYISLLDIDALRGKSTLINSDIILADDSAKLSNTGVYAGTLNNPVITLSGAINNLSKAQNLNLHLSVPKQISFVIPTLKNSNMLLRGETDITGTVANPYMKGLLNVPKISIPDMAVEIKNLVTNLNGPILTGTATINSLKSGGIVVENLASEFSLKNYNALYLNNILGDAFGGKISGNVFYGLSDGKIGVKLNGSNLNAVNTIEGAAGIKNALSGVLGFKADIKTFGATDTAIIKNMTGNVSFNIDNGKFLNVGRFDNLLYAQNILANAVLKTLVTTVTNIPIIQNTAEFKYIKGNLSLSQGVANLHTITTSGPLMAYYITGKYNLLNGTTNVIILGRIDEKVVAVLGPLGDLSVDKLTSYIPKFGALTGSLIKSMTSNPATENVQLIPALSSGSNSYKDFKVVFNGGIDSKSSVKSFKWLSNCDTSAIDVRQEVKNQINSVKDLVNTSRQDFRDTANSIKNDLNDTKQQLQDAKDDLMNLFKF